MAKNVQFYQVNTRGYELNLVCEIECTKPTQLVAKGFDSEHINTTFFSRNVLGENGQPLMGRKKVEFPLPMSPEILFIDLFDGTSRSKEGIHLRNVSWTPLKKAEVWSDVYVISFIKFAKQFAMEAGYLSAGLPKNPKFYASDDRNFIIEYSVYITDYETGQESSTPARTNRQSGQMEISQKFFCSPAFTVPMRLLILLHEFGHHYLLTGDEIKADLFSLEIFLGLGGSKIEAVHAFTKVFKPTQKAQERLGIVMNYIENYGK